MSLADIKQNLSRGIYPQIKLGIFHRETLLLVIADIGTID